MADNKLQAPINVVADINRPTPIRRIFVNLCVCQGKLIFQAYGLALVHVLTKLIRGIFEYEVRRDTREKFLF